MTVFTRGTEYHYMLRPRTPGDASAAVLTDGMRELARSLHLLRATGIHISLFKFAFLDHDCVDGLAVVTHAFGREGIVGRLPDDSVALMLVKPGRDDHATESRVADDLAAACLDFGLTGMVEVSAIHPSACDVSDLDELLLHLALRVPHLLTVEHRHIAAA